MNVLIPSSIDFLSQVVHILSSGGMIIYPTETTYGLGVDATNERAVQKLLQYKKRRDGKPLSIAVADIQMAEKYVVLNNVARNVYKQFLPGPVTVISSGKHRVATFVESNHGTLGIRISSYPLVNEIVYAFGKPITATGANASDQKRPYSIVDVFSFLDDT
ncbi:MAG: threonylcarbamoyl-AMP synthase, partial [Candidatus Pacebacteria bacterium RIFOXYB1_FULL_44_10]